VGSREDDFEAFVAGYRACLFNYAVHRDGNLEVGVQRKPHRRVSKEVPEDSMVLAAFGAFMRARGVQEESPPERSPVIYFDDNGDRC
jgi:hypothetical protein